MKSGHNTRQDRPIVNATDVTSNALIRARTLAQPVCAAADSPTANSGRGMMNARRSISGRWCSMAVLVMFAAVVLAASIAPALASAGSGKYLCNQTSEIGITILNVYSYPAVGGNWTIRFDTTGTANLTITATSDFNYSSEVTRWSNECEDSALHDLEFIELKGGNETQQYKWIGEDCLENECSVFIENYSSDKTSCVISKVLTAKPHVLKFKFGNQEVFAYNDVVGNEVFLQGNYVEVGVHEACSFGTAGNAPEGYHTMGGRSELGFVADHQKDGWTNGTPPQTGDYFLPGNPEESWSIEWTYGSEYTFTNSGRNGKFEITRNSIEETSSGTTNSAVWVGEASSGPDQKIRVTKNIYFNDDDLFFVISVTMTNIGSVALDSVQYIRNVDPDQESDLGGSTTTTNKIVLQPGHNGNTDRALVTGTSLNYGLTLGLGCIDTRAKVATLSGLTHWDPDDVLNTNQSVDYTITNDQAICLAYDFGSLAVGQSVSFDYCYVLNASDLDKALGNLAAVTILQPTGTISGSSVVFQATTDDVTNTTQMEFYVNGSSIGVDTTSDAGGVFEKTFDSTVYEDGTINLKVIATISGSTFEKSSTVTVDNSGPPIEFSTPTVGQTFAGDNIPIAITVLNESHPPVHVSFFREAAGTGSLFLGEDTEAPFNSSFNVTDIPKNETVVIKAVAYDNLGRTTTIQVSGTTASNSPPNAPTSPQCEGQTNPTAISDFTPKFSWTFSDPDGGNTQSAYQIIVGTSEGSDDMWNSSKVTNTSSSIISYAGLALDPVTTYYWKVKTWDNQDVEGSYCANQTFTTAGPTLTLGNVGNIIRDWGINFSMNHSVTVANAAANNVNVTYNVSWITDNDTMETIAKDGMKWHNQTRSNSTVQKITVKVDANTTTASATNASETFSINITRREITITADPVASQSVNPNTTFWINGSAEGEYAETFIGFADLIRDGSIIDNKTTTGGNANFSRTEPAEGAFNFSIKFYNATHYNDKTTSNATRHIVDDTPPASITGLDNLTTEQSRIRWEWTDPTDADFAEVMIYLDGAFKTNVSKGARNYTATGLNPNTTYTIGTHTVDDKGNINQTWENDTARTLQFSGLQRINVTPDSWTLNITEFRDFNATGYDHNDDSIDPPNITFGWGTTPSGVGTLNATTGSVVNFTARHAGRTEVYAVNGSVSSNETYKVWITVNAPPETENVANGTGNTTSGNSTAIVMLNNGSINGTITIEEIGYPLNETEDIGSRTGLGTDSEPIKGVNVTVNGSIEVALNAMGGHVHIRIEYNESQLGNIDENSLYIYKFVNGTGWARLVAGNPPYCSANGRNTTADYVWVNVTNCSIFLLAGTGAATPTPSGGGGGDGTYPPGWFETPAPTVTATKTPAASMTATDAPPGDKVTPAPTKKPEAAKTTAPAAEGTTAETPKSTPGFTAVFVIAGMLAVAYAMMRRRG